MNHKIKFPPRAMMAAGRMRSGKTTLAQKYAASSAMSAQKVLVITERRYLRDAEGTIGDMARHDKHNVKYLAFDTRMEKDFPSPKDLQCVIFMLDSVYSGDDTVLTYEKPSGALKKFLDKLDDPFSIVPYILFTCHMPDAIEPLIQTRTVSNRP